VTESVDIRLLDSAGLAASARLGRGAELGTGDGVLAGLIQFVVVCLAAVLGDRDNDILGQGLIGPHARACRKEPAIPGVPVHLAVGIGAVADDVRLRVTIYGDDDVHIVDGAVFFELLRFVEGEGLERINHSDLFFALVDESVLLDLDRDAGLLALDLDVVRDFHDLGSFLEPGQEVAAEELLDPVAFVQADESVHDDGHCSEAGNIENHNTPPKST
jgi:hypothetical protein